MNKYKGDLIDASRKAGLFLEDSCLIVERKFA
jgi:hypothetical protein